MPHGRGVLTPVGEVGNVPEPNIDTAAAKALAREEARLQGAIQETLENGEKDSDTDSESKCSDYSSSDSDGPSPPPKLTMAANRKMSMMGDVQLNSPSRWPKLDRIKNLANPYVHAEHCHTLYHTKRKIVPLKNYHAEARAMKDIEKFMANPIVLFKVKGSTWDDIALELLYKLKKEKPELNLDVKKIVKCIVDKKGDFRIPERLQGVVLDEDNCPVTEHSFITVLGSTSGVTECHEVMCVLDKSINLGPNMTEVKFICLILAPDKGIKHTKSAIEVGRTYSTLLADHDLRRNISKAHSPAAFALQFEISINNKRTEHRRTQLSRKSKDAGDATAQEGHAEKSFLGNIMRDSMPPGKDIWHDIKRRAPWYLSDYYEGLGSWNGIQKITSATLFLYFALLLPGIAFGVLYDYYTDGALDARKVILSQVFSGLIHSVFSGQPLIIIRTSIPVLIYTKVVVAFAKQFSVPFLTFYAWVGMWNAFFVIIYAFTGASKIMALLTRSTEETLGMFISIAFVLDGVKYLKHEYELHYCFDETNSYCDPQMPLLATLLVCGTVLIGLSVYNFKFSQFLNADKRVFVADYALVVAVLVMSFVGSYLFKDIATKPFTDNGSKTPFTMNPLEFNTLNGLSGTVGVVLGLVMSTLFYVEQNIVGSMVNNPRNRLKKGSAFHLDMLVIGIINFVLSIFGLPWLHAALPHSPLHVRALADIEDFVDNGHLKETVVRVRETRITNLVSHILLAVSMLMIPYPLTYLPIPVLYGLFVFLGLSSISNFQMWERFVLIFTEQKLYPPAHYIRQVPQRVVHYFTFLQLCQLGVLCYISFSGSAYLKMMFPIVILLFIPIRLKLMPKVIKARYLEALDG